MREGEGTKNWKRPTENIRLIERGLSSDQKQNADERDHRLSEEPKKSALKENGF